MKSKEASEGLFIHRLSIASLSVCLSIMFCIFISVVERSLPVSARVTCCIFMYRIMTMVHGTVQLLQDDRKLYADSRVCITIGHSRGGFLMPLR